MKHLLLVLLFPTILFAGDIVFDQIGFQTPTGLVLVHKDGAVKWGKSTPAETFRLFWDAMVTEKAVAASPETADKAQVIADYNSAVLLLKENGKLLGKEDEQAQKLWKTLKNLFPQVFK